MTKMNWNKVKQEKLMQRDEVPTISTADKILVTKATTGMPKAGPVKIIKIDGTVEIEAPYRGGSTKNIDCRKVKKSVSKKATAKRAKKPNKIHGAKSAPAAITHTQKSELEKLGVVTDSTWTEADARKVLRVAKVNIDKQKQSDEFIINVERKKYVKPLTAFDDKLIYKMKCLEAIKAKQGYLNGAMSQELKRLKNLYKNVK